MQWAIALRNIQVILGVIVISTSLVNAGFQEFSVDYHNSFRELKDLPPLQFDEQLGIKAHAYAEKLATMSQLTPSPNGYGENLWAHRGPLRSLTISCRDAINNWFTGSEFPGHITSLRNPLILRSNHTRFFGIGVGTHHEYTVVVAYYS